MSKRESLFKNFIYNALYNSMSVVFPLITIPYVSRILLSDGLGKVNYANNIVAWFLLFASLGIPRYGIREIAKNRDNQNNLNQSFSELFYINFISSGICSFIYISIIWIAPYFNDKILLYVVTGIQLFLNVFNVDWFYQGIEEYAYITKRSFVFKVCSMVAMFLFVRNQADYIVYALIQSIALTGNYIFNFYNLRKYVAFSFSKINLKKHMSSILILLSTQLAVNMYTLLDTTMLGFWCSNSVIGYYSNVQKIIKTIAVLTASLGGVMLPRLVNMFSLRDLNSVKKISEKALDMIIVMCLPISVGLLVVAKDMVLVFFGNDFSPCIKTMMIFAPFIVFSTVGNLFGTQLLMVFGKEQQLLKSVVLGSVINFTLNFILIKRLYQDGAALASVITECIVMIVQIIMVNKCIKIRLNIKSFFQIIFMTAIMICGVLVVQSFILNQLINLVVSISFGITIYVTLGFVLKNNAFVSLVTVLKTKIWH